jgi:hypothetical protein
MGAAEGKSKMSLLFCDGMDKYGAANTNSTVVAGLLTAGEWTTTTGTITVVAGLCATGFAINQSAVSTLVKTLSGNYARLIGGVRFSSTLATNPAGIQFLDGGTAQCAIAINAAGTVSVKNGVLLSGTVLGTSTASITANTTHYLEWDISFGNAASYQIWMDGVSILSGSGDTTATANNTASGVSLACQNTTAITYDDFYLFDTTGTANNAVLLTSPRIETQFPSSDGAVQFAVGAAILGSSVQRGATQSISANQMRVKSVTPLRACTIASISVLGGINSGSPSMRPVIYTDSTGSPGTLLSAGATVTGITSGAVTTMPLTTPQVLTAGTPYWIGFMADVAVTNGLAASGDNDRIATVTFSSGAPGTAPVTTSTGGAVIWGSVSGVGTNAYVAGQNPPQGSQSYLFDATVGHEDLYNFPALTASAPTIYAAAVKASVSKSDAGAKTISLRTKSGATDSPGSASSIAPGTSYAWATSLFATDPATSAAWTLAALNAAQSGIKVES